MRTKGLLKGIAAVSESMSSYWANFAANGDPNGAGLPNWPMFDGSSTETVMMLPIAPRDPHRPELVR